MKSSRLSTRLSLFILTAVTVVYLSALAYNFQASRQALLTDMIQDAKNISLATGYDIERLLVGVEKIPESLAGVLAERQLSREELFQLLTRLLAVNPEIFGMAVAYEPRAFETSRLYFAPYAYREGDRIGTTVLGSPEYHYFTMDWYQIPRETGRAQWTSPYFDKGGGDIIMSTYAVPFYQGQGPARRLKGVVTADLSLSKLRQTVGAVKIFETGYAFLICQNGTFVTFPDQRLVMRESIFSLAAAKNNPALRSLGRRMIRGEQGVAPITDFLKERQAWLGYTPLGHTGWSLGVMFPEDELISGLVALSHQLLFLGVGGLVLLGALITVLARSITNPLRRLAQSTTAIARGDFHVRVPERGAREIAELAASFNAMGEHLVDYIAKRDFIRDTFGRYVTHEVVKTLLESQEALELGGETRRVTILMSDLRGFTALTAGMAPERVITFLNRYLEKMIEILVDYEAVIDEIQGDGILAFFGAPRVQLDHAPRAVACALAMQQAMAEVNAANARDGFPHLEMGIGVGHGEVVVGNIGSELRTKYSIVGSPVNFTSRIEALATAGQVLLSEPCYREVQDLVKTGEVIRARMKGIPGEVTLYEILGIGAPYNLELEARRDELVPLIREQAVSLERIQEKIVVGTLPEAFLSHVSETRAQVRIRGELAEWEDVRLHWLDERGEIIATARIYGKVTALTPHPDGTTEAALRFTSVSPEARRTIHRLLETA
uniref:HAMP domain-containing protein n=1 Tax=Desulfobacca acetoxidans TaxID=60893 RepID=A0A7V4G6E8_9BACT